MLQDQLNRNDLVNIIAATDWLNDKADFHWPSRKNFAYFHVGPMY